MDNHIEKLKKRALEISETKNELKDSKLGEASNAITWAPQ
jgi:hypothetical protein